MNRTRLIGYAAIAAIFFSGYFVGWLNYHGNSAVDIAPNGMAYCPTDASTPHPTPCMFRQP